MSSPTPEQWSAMGKLVQSFYQRADAEPFREPVDWQNLGLVDYPKIIKKPMDLGTIKKAIVDRKYKSLAEVDEHVRLVWTNCMTYNADGSDFFLLAQSLNKKWNDKFNKLMADLDIAPAPGRGTDASGSKISMEDKRAFAKSLYKISKEELGKILVEVEMKCPAALTRNNAEDEVELNVDKLTANILSDLQTYVSKCGTGGGPKRKKSTGASGGSNKRTKVA